MDSETASSVDEQVGGGGGGGSVGADTRGRHRILAELKRVEQEIKFYQEEMEELENTENVSSVCAELLRNIQAIPDPLLSETIGPLNPIWDRWFEGPPPDSDGCRCWIL
ncbi:guanine nucleotide-binding protein subunit gamma 1-like [Mercurialis annua]|uniref:guanine nucleotide-binding protein subunit gamma 1-like n=1 Tax=Mercurialis annua TaxID=3986 RepID=UPI00215F3486|nr:guanine nucleotide-binding protein subunit gamma 1-like [Mercurialis annua]